LLALQHNYYSASNHNFASFNIKYQIGFYVISEKLASPFLCGTFKSVVCAIDMPWVDRCHIPFTHWKVLVAF